MNYNGFLTKNISITDDNDAIIEGDIIKLNTTGKASKAVNNDDFVGVVTSKRGNLLSVQVLGYIECDYSGTAPGFGFRRITANGSNGVKTSDTGRQCLILKVETSSSTVGFILL